LAVGKDEGFVGIGLRSFRDTCWMLSPYAVASLKARARA